MESIPDQRYYFQSLLQEATKAGHLTEAETERIQMELVELMGKEVERYTNDESSSVPIEKAREILNSVTYNIGYCLKTNIDMTQKIAILKTKRISDLFHMGMEAVDRCKADAFCMLLDLQANCLKLNNFSYQDTINKGLSEFFQDYHIEFGADQIPCDIDYQLCTTRTDLLGVEFIEEYLKQLSIEDRFLRHFSERDINRLLLCFDREVEHMLINIIELVLVNAMGRCLLGCSSVKELVIVRRELTYLQDYFEKQEDQEVRQILMSSLIRMKQELSLDQEVFEYSKTAIPQIAVRIRHNLQTGTLDKLFMVLPEDSAHEVIYEDVALMEDDKLRLLIEQLRVCGSTREKVSLILEQVKSMADFTELMEECFYEEEYEEVFHSLTEADKTVLMNILQSGYGPEYDENLEPRKLWQKMFLQTT